MKRTLATAALTFTFALTGGIAHANPNPPTEGGNGAGSSGQCTGNPDGRPSSCHDQGGPGNQP